MHSYSIDTNERRNCFFIFAVISVFFCFHLNQVLDHHQISFSDWFKVPSPFVLYLIIFTIFNKWLWRYFNKFNFIKTPNLQGIWRGHLKSSVDDHSSEIETEVKTIQTWTKMKILLKTGKSSSYSQSASILIEAVEGESLLYQYMNEPNPDTGKSMNIHRGTVKLTLGRMKRELNGQYYSDGNRKSFGTLSLIRNK